MGGGIFFFFFIFYFMIFLSYFVNSFTSDIYSFIREIKTMCVSVCYKIFFSRRSTPLAQAGAPLYAKHNVKEWQKEFKIKSQDS